MQGPNTHNHNHTHTKSYTHNHTHPHIYTQHKSFLYKFCSVCVQKQMKCLSSSCSWCQVLASARIGCQPWCGTLRCTSSPSVSDELHTLVSVLNATLNESLSPFVAHLYVVVFLCTSTCHQIFVCLLTLLVLCASVCVYRMNQKRDQSPYWDSVLVHASVYVRLVCACPGGAIIILKALKVDGLMGTRDAAEATILLFCFHGIATAGLTYCLSYLFKSPAAAQNVMIFVNVGCKS